MGGTFMPNTNQLPSIDPTQAIAFAVEKIEDHYDRLEFLQLWMRGDWAEIRNEWPEVFTTADGQNDSVLTLIERAQSFIDRKYVARADERQKSMGLAYVEAERQDLAREVANFTAVMVLQKVAEISAKHAAEMADATKRIAALRAAWSIGD